MSNQKARVKVTSSAKDFCKVLGPDGKSHTLALDDKVVQFNPNGLEDGCHYNISYDDETNMISYAKKDDTDTREGVTINPIKEKVSPTHPKESSSKNLTDKEKKDKGYVLLGGKWYATLKVLLNTAHEVYGNQLSIVSELVSHDEEKKSAVFKSTVSTPGNPFNELSDCTFTGYGHSNQSNTGAMVKETYLVMAETRAVVRALRFATNIAECSLEELPGDKEE